ncbi:MAG: HD domain-containing protein [Holophagales bacterium]|jgi:HD-GYP domain-containing protein (c-di-GMP phosphodiesterase class II)|nr:HD domain-containing protein [Holophagales bacterium]
MKELLRRFGKYVSRNLMMIVYFSAGFAVIGISIYSQRQMVTVINSSEHNFRDKLIADAKRLAPLATLEELNNYRVPADAQRPEWKALRQKLIEFAEDAEVKYAYYLRVEGDKVQYIVDNDLDENTRSGIDTEPEELSTYIDIKPTLEGEACVSQLGEYAKDWPGLVSAYVPLFDDNGRVAAICGVDVDDRNLLEMHAMERWLIVIKTLAFIILYVSGVFCIGGLNKMVEIKIREVVKLQNAIMHGVANMVESRDSGTGEHIERTQHYLRALIDSLSKMGLYQKEMKEWDIELMIESSQLHDVGKIAISDSILNKPGSLTTEEFEIMKKHVESGITIIERIEQDAYGTDFLRYAKIIAQTHHEKWDGSGYPKGLAGSDIPLPGRLMAIADMYDALTSSRSYKDPYPSEEAARIIREGRGTHFDPVLVDAFEQVADRFASIARRPSNQHIT